MSDLLRMAEARARWEPRTNGNGRAQDLDPLAAIHARLDHIQHELARLSALINNSMATSPDLGKSIRAMPERMRKICIAVCNSYGVTEDDLFTQSRLAHMTMPRQVAMYLCMTRRRWGSVTVGKYFGRDHSTVIHARDKIVSLRFDDKDMSARLLAIEAELDAAGA